LGLLNEVRGFIETKRIADTYKHTNNKNQLIPDHYVIYNREYNAHRDIVSTYIAYFNDSKSSKRFDKNQFKQLISEIENERRIAINELNHKIEEKKNSINLKQTLVQELKVLKVEINNKSQQLSLIKEEISLNKALLSQLQKELQLEERKINQISLDYMP